MLFAIKSFDGAPRRAIFDPPLPAAAGSIAAAALLHASHTPLIAERRDGGLGHLRQPFARQPGR